MSARLRGALGLLGAGQWSALREKLRRRLRVPPLRVASSAQFWDAVSEGGARKVTLHIAAALGGGAQDVLERRLGEERQRGEHPVLLSLDSLTGELVASWHAGGRSRRARLRDYPLSPAPLAAPHLSAVRCNSLVGFPRPVELLAQLRELAAQQGVPLAFEWHDHYLACPVHTLLDYRGAYCGIPAAEVCATCLARHPAAPAAAREIGSIGQWREATGSALAAAAELRVFSASSAGIIARSFPDDSIAGSRIEPHSMRYFAAARAVAADAAEPLHVGVIGRIGGHKGAGEVAALGEEIRRRGSPARITVIGTIDVAVDRRVVQVTGAYHTADLPALVLRTGVNVILLPSVCPETFSFVAHEVIAMQLPLLTFNLGAQAECAASYPRGCVIERGGADLTLEALEQLHRRSYQCADRPARD